VRRSPAQGLLLGRRGVQGLRVLPQRRAGRRWEVGQVLRDPRRELLRLVVARSLGLLVVLFDLRLVVGVVLRLVVLLFVVGLLVFGFLVVAVPCGSEASRFRLTPTSRRSLSPLAAREVAARRSLLAKSREVAGSASDRRFRSAT
jgi:hypothetical protein